MDASLPLDRHDVVVLGEALVDFFPTSPGQPLRDVEHFTRSVGGAPTNVCVGLARLGSTPRLLTRLGDDEFGRYLLKALTYEGVDTSHVVFTQEASTGITFISLSASGERSFMAPRATSAEWTITPEDFEVPQLELARVFYTGSNLMPKHQGLRTTRTMLQRAHRAGCLVAMDANLRLHHWPDPQDALDTIRSVFGWVDLLKVSDEEMVYFLEGDDNPHALFEACHEYGVQSLIVTRGARGAHLLTANHDLFVDASTVDAVDTTGAGDGFCAGLIHALLQLCPNPEPSLRTQLRHLDLETWRKAIELANHVGGQVCTRLGATTALPRAAELNWP